jgi:hypothetical protein
MPTCAFISALVLAFAAPTAEMTINFERQPSIFGQFESCTCRNRRRGGPPRNPRLDQSRLRAIGALSAIRRQRDRRDAQRQPDTVGQTESG